ncbi:hypothetical protein T439DRAFT_383631 [Meredithblackwellia eburnea MCA 4105]
MEERNEEEGLMGAEFRGVLGIVEPPLSAASPSTLPTPSTRLARHLRPLPHQKRQNNLLSGILGPGSSVTSNTEGKTSTSDDDSTTTGLPGITGGTGTGTSSKTTSTSSSSTSTEERTSSSGTSTSSSPSSTSSTASSTSSSTSSSSSSSSLSSTQTTSTTSNAVVTHTVVQTDSNGDKTTSTSTSTAEADKNAPKPSSTAKTWGIVGGVVGGSILLAGVSFLIWRCSQKRFEDEDFTQEDFRWPEMQPDGYGAPQTSTLYPQATHRTGGAGFDMSERDDDAYGGVVGGGRGAASQYHDRSDSMGSHSEGHGNTAGIGAGFHERYNNFLGPSAAPQPPPQNLYPHPSIHSQSASISSYPGGGYVEDLGMSQAPLPLPAALQAGHGGGYPSPVPSRAEFGGPAGNNISSGPLPTDRSGTPLNTQVNVGGVSFDRVGSPDMRGALKAMNL